MRFDRFSLFGAILGYKMGLSGRSINEINTKVVVISIVIYIW